MIGIVDFGMGNLTSVVAAIEHLERRSKIVRTPDDAEKCSKLIIPGVGHFGRGIRNLKASGLSEFVVAHASEGKPLLGICLGMQLLFEASEETRGFSEPGLSLFPGTLKKFSDTDSSYPPTNIGWREVSPTDTWSFAPRNRDELFFYFVHSYFLPPSGAEFEAGNTTHGVDFVSVVESENIMGVQFHPEKSQGNGLALLDYFCGV